MAWGGAMTLLAIAITVVVFVFMDFNHDIPKFPFLGDSPDTTLHGTVAYVATDNCIHLVALSGSQEKVLYCLPKWDPDEAAKLGKPMPPQLVWLSDGRLEVTIFRMTKGPQLIPGWQQIIDSRTGEVTDIPASLTPTQANLSTRPVTSPSGGVVSFTSNEETGHVTISVTNAAGVKSTLLDVRGPNHYAYRLTSAFWAPDFKSIIADDGRILVLTLGPPPVTRVLSKVGGGNPFGEPSAEHSGFAITSEELIPAK